MIKKVIFLFSSVKCLDIALASKTNGSLRGGGYRELQFANIFNNVNNALQEIQEQVEDGADLSDIVDGVVSDVIETTQEIQQQVQEDGPLSGAVNELVTGVAENAEPIFSGENAAELEQLLGLLEEIDLQNATGDGSQEDLLGFLIELDQTLTNELDPEQVEQFYAILDQFNETVANDLDQDLILEILENFNDTIGNSPDENQLNEFLDAMNDTLIEFDGANVEQINNLLNELNETLSEADGVEQLNDLLNELNETLSEADGVEQLSDLLNELNETISEGNGESLTELIDQLDGTLSGTLPNGEGNGTFTDQIGSIGEGFLENLNVTTGNDKNISEGDGGADNTSEEIIESKDENIYAITEAENGTKAETADEGIETETENEPLELPTEEPETEEEEVEKVDFTDTVIPKQTSSSRRIRSKHLVLCVSYLSAVALLISTNFL